MTESSAEIIFGLESTNPPVWQNFPFCNF